MSVAMPGSTVTTTDLLVLLPFLVAVTVYVVVSVGTTTARGSCLEVASSMRAG